MKGRTNVLWLHDVTASNCNAQSLNAKAILSRWPEGAGVATALAFGPPDSRVVTNDRVRVHKVFSTRFLLLQLVLLVSLRPWDVVVLPGLDAKKDLILAKIIRVLKPRTRIVVTVEGLLTLSGGTSSEIPQLTKHFGHPVFGQPVQEAVYRARAKTLGLAHLVVPISDFLAECVAILYPQSRMQVIPLGIDRSIFFPASSGRRGVRRVLSAGSLSDSKRPGLFIDLARRFPQVSFEWFGAGPLERLLDESVQRSGIKNIRYTSPVSPHELAENMRESDLFVFPSIAEGVPKVTQEAAACGLPIVAMNYYEPHSVSPGINGFLVSSDAELFARVESLIGNAGLVKTLSCGSLGLASAWDWDELAARWAFTCARCT